MATPTQTHRPIRVSTPLGDDTLVFRRMSTQERLGRAFSYDLELYSTDFDIGFEDLLGQPVGVAVDTQDDATRYYHGIVSRFSLIGRAGEFAHYRAILKPWMWLLSRRSDCRIFQAQSAPDIINQVFSDAGFDDVEDRLNGDYRSRTYCVQYRETDFDFVSRIMENEGIYYYFTHEAGRHVLVLADGYTSHDPMPGYDDIPYYPYGETMVRESDHFYHWNVGQQVTTGNFALNDYDFTAPGKSLRASAAESRNNAHAENEIYDYPGLYQELGHGNEYARVRIDELQADFEQTEGIGNLRGIYVGGLFSLRNYPRKDQNREYLITALTCNLSVDEYQSVPALARESFCEVRTEAIDSTQAYRPPAVTRKAFVQGPQTAVVVGPSGEEIYTDLDGYGMVKVQFHWDRHGKNDENSSCWVRVSSPWAGAQWGAVQIPRIGQEVVVDFLEGDPDQPIIIGRVYNADQRPPYEFPANKTQSGMKSRSSPGGSSDNFNEIRFEDLKGSEELYIHAEKDHTNITENDRTEDVGNDRSLHVGHDKTEAIDNNKTITVGVDHGESIGGNKTLSVDGNHTETVAKDMKVDVGANLNEAVKVNYTETVGGAMAVSVGGAMAITVGAVMAETVALTKTQTIQGASDTTVSKDASEKVGGAKSVNVDKTFDETVKEAYSLKAKTVSIVADDEISIVTGEASITMKKDGTINIKGKDVSVDGKGKVNIKASDNVIVKGKKVLQN